MRRPRHLTAIIALPLVALALWAPAAAGAESTYNRLLTIYEQTGSIPPCSFTSAQLNGVLKSADTYAAQYFADFTNAISTALAQRAAGQCAHTHAAAAVGLNAGNVALPLPRVPAATGAGVPLPLLLLAIIGGVLLLLGAGVLAVQLTGWQPPRRRAWGR